MRRQGTENQLVKTRPGSSTPEVLRKWSTQDPPSRTRTVVDWSPDGNWILTDGDPSGLFLMSPDGAVERQLSSRTFARRGSRGFSRDGRQVLCLERSTASTGAEWRLLAIDVATGIERNLAAVDLPPSVAGVAGFSPHPDGTRFITSASNFAFDIWMVEGFERRR
jgi:Tol biopolymer transport system component